MARRFVFQKFWQKSRDQVSVVLSSIASHVSSVMRYAVPRGRVRAVSIGTLVLFTLVGYQNCGNDFVASGAVDLSSASAEECDAALQATFQQSFYPFTSVTCKACHVPGGIGKGAFASTDISVAYNAFMLDTPSEIEARAVDPSHAAGITGPANQSAIASAKAIWDSAEASCNSGAPSTAIVTIDKPINGSATVKTISFSLNSEIVGSTTNFGGATFSVGVQQVTNISGDTLYYFTNPTLKTGTLPINVGKMIVRLNGVNQPLMTTWTQLNFSVAAGATQNMCTTTATDPFAFAASDTIGVSFQELSVGN